MDRHLPLIMGALLLSLAAFPQDIPENIAYTQIYD